MKDCLIIGYGVVGKNLFRELQNIEPDIVDKYHPEYNTIKDGERYDVGFICVDTPLVNGKLDITEVKNAILENRKRCRHFCIKSTLPVGALKLLRTIVPIVYSPEFYGNTVHNKCEFNFTILGGTEWTCRYIVQVLLKCYDASHKFIITSAKTAQMVKFMENAWIATKVSFCNSFADMCRKNGILYENVRELFLLDPRVNPSHTFVYDWAPYWDSHCLNKDVPAIANQFDNEFLKGVIEYNEKQKRKNGYYNTVND